MFNNIVEGFGGQDMKTEYLELNRCNYHCLRLLLTSKAFYSKEKTPSSHEDN